VERGILSPAEATAITARQVAPHAAAIMGAAPGRHDAVSSVTIQGGNYGLTEDFSVLAPAESPRFAVAGAASLGSLEPGDPELAARSYVDDLFRRGQVTVPKDLLTEASIKAEESATRTHEIIRGDSGPTLVRLLFD
jgi:hypothetical protein